MQKRGKPLLCTQRMNECRKCDKEIHWDDDVCPHCGIELPHYVSEQALKRQKHWRQEKLFRVPFLQLLVPKFDRLALFMMAVSCLLVWFKSPELRKLALELQVPGYVMVVMVGFGAGLVFSLFFGVTTVPLGTKAKEAMLFFAVIVNLVCGVAAGWRMLTESHGWMLLFPIWNLLNCHILVIIFFTFVEYDRFYEAAVKDFRVNRFLIGVAFVLVLAAFVISHEHLHLGWAATLSICVTCSTNFSGILQFLFSRSAVRL